MSVKRNVTVPVGRSERMWTSGDSTQGLCEHAQRANALESFRLLRAEPGEPAELGVRPPEERARVVGSVARQEALCNLLLPDLRPRLSRARTRQRVRGGRRRRAEAPRSR